MSDYDYLDKGNVSGTVFGRSTSSLLGFWGITPVDQPAALTAALTTITVVSATTYMTAIASCDVTAVYGFGITDEAQSFLMVVQNLQIRQAEMEARLVEAGIIAGGTDAPTKVIYDFVGKGGDEGTVFGQDSASLISFWGIAPCDQPAALTTGLATILVTCSTTTITATIGVLASATGGYGFVTMTGGHSFLQAVANLQIRMGQAETNLVEAGLIAGGTGLTSTVDYDYLSKGNDDGTIMGYSSTQLLGFWGTAPCDQAAALTTAATTITCTAAGTADYAIATMTAAGGFKFLSTNEAQTVLYTVYNLQTRMAEIEAALEGCGLIAAN